MRTKNTARRNQVPVPNIEIETTRNTLEKPRRFRTKAHKKFHDSVTIKRAFIQERPLVLENSIFGDLPKPFAMRQWVEFARHPSPCCKNIVREFYANAMNLPKTEEIEKFTSVVRGKVVRFDKDTITRVLSLPEDLDEEGFSCYFSRMLHSGYDPDDVLNTVSDGNDFWRVGTNRRPRSLKRKYLKPMAMELLNVILANIQPSMHSSEVTLERVFLLYVLMKGYDLNLANVLADEIHRSIIIHNRGMTHPSLIYKLCIHAGVPDEIEDRLMPGEKLGERMLNRKKSRLASERDSEDEIMEERPRTSSSSAQQGYGPRIISSLERLEEKFESRISELEKKMTRLEKIGKFLKKQGEVLMKLFKKSHSQQTGDPKGKGKALAEDDDDFELEMGGDDFNSSSEGDGGDGSQYFVAPTLDDDPYGDDSPV